MVMVFKRFSIFIPMLRLPIWPTSIERLSRQTFRIQLFYALVYPFASGIVIYAGLMAFSLVLTNITGFLPQIARDLYEGHLNTASSIFLWLIAFFLGGFIAGFCVEREKLKKLRYLHLLPLVLVAAVFTTVGLSGHDSVTMHPVAFPAMVLLSVGILNAMVSLTTSSLVKASQMTGVINELGVDIAELFHSDGEQRRLIRREATLRLVVMSSFISGAVVSVAWFPILKNGIFFIPASIITLVILHDILRFRKSPIGTKIQLFEEEDEEGEKEGV